MSKALTHYIVAAFVEDIQEVGFFLIPRESKGLEIADNWNMLGMRATESHDLVLNDVIVPFENFVETKHKPQPNGWILHIPSVYLGIAQAARDYAIEFAKTHSLIVLMEQLLRYLLYNKMLEKWNHSYYLLVIFMEHS